MVGSTATLAQSQLCVFPPLDTKKTNGPSTCFQSVPALNCNHLQKTEEISMNRSAPSSPCTKYCFDHHKRKLSSVYSVDNEVKTDRFPRDGEICKVILIDEDNIATEWIDDDVDYQTNDELNKPLLKGCGNNCMHASLTKLN